jgi:hypothetical protein
MILGVTTKEACWGSEEHAEKGDMGMFMRGGVRGRSNMY